ncbi:MAG: VanW family protein [Syntrophomonadaceae bacterium]
MERDAFGAKSGVSVEGVIVERLLPGELEEVVRGIALQYQKLPVEPRLDKQTGLIISEEIGYTVDIEATLARLRACQPGENVELRKIVLAPRHRGVEIKNAQQTVIGSYSTWFHGSPARYQNIATAMRSVNNTLLWPDQVFSFNEFIGPRTPERGYLPAPVILNGDLDVGYGGGVCQVSSTIYNAALAANLTIIERHSHSKPVHYVPEGRDAAVDYGGVDLKFKNNRSTAVIIKSSLYNGRLYIELRGAEQT